MLNIELLWFYNQVGPDHVIRSPKISDLLYVAWSPVHCLYIGPNYSGAALDIIEHKLTIYLTLITDLYTVHASQLNMMYMHNMHTPCILYRGDPNSREPYMANIYCVVICGLKFCLISIFPPCVHNWHATYL